MLAAERVRQGAIAPAALPGKSFCDFFAAHADRGLEATDQVLVFDQFEEVLTTDANDTATHSSEGIFSDKARKALSDAFAGLEPGSHQTGNEQVPSMSGLPLEALFEKAVREAFEPVLQKWLDDNASALIDRTKPAISEWLDRHFPAMLEDAVRNEVARAVMARRR